MPIEANLPVSTFHLSHKLDTVESSPPDHGDSDLGFGIVSGALGHNWLMRSPLTIC